MTSKMTAHQKRVLMLASQAAIYIPADCEGIRIDYWDTESAALDEEDTPEYYIYGTGEESGEEYRIAFDEVDLDADMFYKLTLMDVPAEVSDEAVAQLTE